VVYVVESRLGKWTFGQIAFLIFGTTSDPFGAHYSTPGLDFGRVLCIHNIALRIIWHLRHKS
jgi:hypothetical protein